jgi:hypothetical protein
MVHAVCPHRILMSMLHVLAFPCCMSMSMLHVIYYLISPRSWQPCPGSTVLAVLSCQSCPGCLVLPVQFSLSCSAHLFLPVLFCMSVLPVLFCHFEARVPEFHAVFSVQCTLYKGGEVACQILGLWHQVGRIQLAQNTRTTSLLISQYLISGREDS